MTNETESTTVPVVAVNLWYDVGSRDELPGRHWVQAYVLRQQDFFWKLVERAHAADYEALVITVDLPVGGKRERDFRNHFSIPFRFSARNIADFASRPAWAMASAETSSPR